MKTTRLPYLYFHMKSLNDLQRPPEPVRTFYRLYVTALLVLAFGALVIWKAESNYREGLKRSPGANSGSPQTHYGAHITGEKDNQPILEL